MAGDSENHTDMNTHVQTYGGMIALLKWGAVASFVAAALVIWLIV